MPAKQLSLAGIYILKMAAKGWGGIAKSVVTIHLKIIIIK